MTMRPHRLLLHAVLGTGVAFGLSGCLFFMHKTPIQPDPKVDPRLEGEWKVTEKRPDEIRNERDEDDFCMQRIVFTRIDDKTYKCLAYDHGDDDVDADSTRALLASTRRYKGHDFLLFRVQDHIKEEARKDGGVAFVDDWLFDYEFNDNGELFLRFFPYEDEDENKIPALLKAHSMEFEQVEFDFGPSKGIGPVVLKGSEQKVLDFYTAPEVRVLLWSFGKYRKLQAPGE